MGVEAAHPQAQAPPRADRRDSSSADIRHRRSVAPCRGIGGNSGWAGKARVAMVAAVAVVAEVDVEDIAHWVD